MVALLYDYGNYGENYTTFSILLFQFIVLVKSFIRYFFKFIYMNTFWSTFFNFLVFIVVVQMVQFGPSDDFLLFFDCHKQSQNQKSSNGPN